MSFCTVGSKGGDFGSVSGGTFGCSSVLQRLVRWRNLRLLLVLIVVVCIMFLTIWRKSEEPEDTNPFRKYVQQHEAERSDYLAVQAKEQQLSANILTPVPKPVSMSPKKPRILYYNRHSACHANMVQITSRLGLDFETFNPGFLGGLGMNGNRADDIINDGLVRLICDAVDIIIVADTMPDARPLIQSLVRETPKERCKANIVLELTTRFDWGVPDKQEYYRLNWQLSSSAPQNLYWVTNNAFEPLDLSYEALATPLFRMLRPTGHSTLEPQNIPEADKNLALCRIDKHSAVFAMMQQMKIPFKHIKGGYGGPKTLAQYKAFIEFPYQVSTMKLYENLAAGIIMLIPSPEFLRELIEKDLHSFGPWDKIARAGKDWHIYMDYYSPDIAPYVYYFRSFEHLKELITSSAPLDFKNVRTEAPKAYERLVKRALHGWADLFGEMGYQVSVDGKAHKQGEDGPEPYRAPLYNPELSPPKTNQEWNREFQKLELWKNKMRTDRAQLATESRKQITDQEMDAYMLSLEYKNPSAKTVLKIDLDKIGTDIDAKLVNLLDFLNGEAEDKLSNPFGGSLVGISALEVEKILSAGLKTLHEIVMAVPSNAIIETSNYSLISKLHRSFRILNQLFHDGLPTLSIAANKSVTHLTSLLSKQEISNFQRKKQVLQKTLYPWAFSLKFTTFPSLMSSFSHLKGIVMTFGNAGFERGLLTILHLRKNLQSTLPVEVFYNGKTDLDYEFIEALTRLDGVTVKNLQDVFSGLEEERNFHNKPLAILASTFQKVMYLDSDVILFQTPETLLNSSILFKSHGTLFFKGRAYEPGNSKWIRWFLKFPSRMSETMGRFMRDLTKDEMDASLMLFDKTRVDVVNGLLSAVHLNLREVREGGLDKHLQGDRDTYWVAFELLRIPYTFVPTVAGAIGTCDERPYTVCGPASHVDENQHLLHVNYHSEGTTSLEISDWTKTVTHYVFPVDNAQGFGNVDVTKQPKCVTASLRNNSYEGVVAAEAAVVKVSVKDLEVLEKLRLLSMEMGHNGWEHYLDNHL